MSQKSELKYTDFKSNLSVRWCPGCGDHAILNAVQKAMANLQVEPHNVAVISGIGCSSRFPYYMNTYGFHTIHGRASAVASGVMVANPDLKVWQITGDGDALAIGGNHFIHLIRRNIDINVILFNNQIYGLTKGQYSPTSKRGFISKTSPYGTVEDPFRPGELTLGARGQFFARTIDKEIKLSIEVMEEAARHKGTSIVEVLQNCVIYNDKTHEAITDKKFKADRTIILRHGEKMIFGVDNNKGLVMDGMDIKAITIGEDGYTLDDVLVHDAYSPHAAIHRKLSNMDFPELPVALGVIRSVKDDCYDESVEQQLKEVQAKTSITTFEEMVNSGDVWEVE
ncbi:2-oxoglutarate ferredoxin oxidoreductase subunit beta [Saccharicrinis carchari]|uniref:2-oxoglutarate ferredoxin oxidoreductase subunit beta n=1 Tax=Saccharicrinis carchari TaxID=1168039 RepID=A0A521FA83_SACCC|nr:2-oxoacid:ferredoxin oxidoreductase subunit beta [Saccharicrinis carchari]SMO93083.1 2-oxoglutarate ferredoxin oxidoreductase subunit beta [Saccharicrinis carchari]